MNKYLNALFRTRIILSQDQIQLSDLRVGVLALLKREPSVRNSNQSINF